MLDLSIALAFVGMILLPAMVAMRSSSEDAHEDIMNED